MLDGWPDVMHETLTRQDHGDVLRAVRSISYSLMLPVTCRVSALRTAPREDAIACAIIGLTSRLAVH